MTGAGGRDTHTAARVASWRGRCVVVLCALAIAAVAAVPASAAEAPATSAPSPEGTTPTPPPPDRTLSNETTSTTWAHPEAEGSIFAQPEAHAHRLGHVHLQTEDGFSEVYMLLSEHTDALGQVWVKLRIPGRPNGRKGWVLRELLGPFHITHWQIVINLRERRLSAYYNGHQRLLAPVGVGKPSSPTPPGHFWIRERFRLTDRSNPYYPYALGTSDYSTLTDWPGGGVVGIHGDFGAPQLIPGDPSHGCVRMHAADLLALAPRITLGTPVDIVAG